MRFKRLFILYTFFVIIYFFSRANKKLYGHFGMFILCKTNNNTIIVHIYKIYRVEIFGVWFVQTIHLD